jgi:hypothetical protein
MKRLLWMGATIGGGITLLFLARGVAALVVATNTPDDSGSGLNIPLPLLEAAVEHVNDRQRQEDLLPSGGMEAKESARGYALDAAIATYEAQVDGLLCTRRAYFLDQARAHQAATGGAQEHYLLDKLQGLQATAQESALKHTTYSGTPEHQAVARPLTMDALALMLAIDSLYTGVDTSSCEVMPMPAIAKGNEFLFAALEYRQWLTQEAQQQNQPSGEAVEEVATDER